MRVSGATQARQMADKTNISAVKLSTLKILYRIELRRYPQNYIINVRLEVFRQEWDEESNKKAGTMGLEPTIFCSVGRRLIH